VALPEGPEGMLNSPNEIEQEKAWHYRYVCPGCFWHLSIWDMKRRKGAWLCPHCGTPFRIGPSTPIDRFLMWYELRMCEREGWWRILTGASEGSYRFVDATKGWLRQRILADVRHLWGYDKRQDDVSSLACFGTSIAGMPVQEALDEALKLEQQTKEQSDGDHSS